MPTGLGGTAPNLDVFLDQGPTAVAIESKFTEYLSAKPASFNDSYEDLVEEIAQKSWKDLYRDLKSDPAQYRHIDVAQLIKHYLGLRAAVDNETFERITLVYLYWEPLDAREWSAFDAHRQDLLEIMARVQDPEVPLISITYPELWDEWSRPEAPDWVKEHLSALRSRYGFAIS